MIDVQRFKDAANIEHAAEWTFARWVTPRVAVGTYRGETIVLIDDRPESGAGKEGGR